MTDVDFGPSLQRLVRLVPPPPIPLEVERPPVCMAFAGGQPVVFPPDYLALVEKYGSGDFWDAGDVGMIASVHNPRAAPYQTVFDREHAFLQEYKEDEGGGHAAYDIFPISPGLLQWGRADGRKPYFWLTDGPPAQWPLILMWDFEFFGRYDMPVVVFLERLISGDLDARFLGDETVPMRLDAARITFSPRPMPPG
jgi:hypothetical protein